MRIEFVSTARLFYFYPMIQLLTLSLLTLLATTACTNSKEENATRPEKSTIVKQETPSASSSGHWKGTFSNGLKGAKISFDVKGSEVKDLTFQGYWRCDGKLELTTLGPEKGFAINGNRVDGVIKESGFYFELHGNFSGNKASGTLRIAFVAGGCDTYKLNWTAEKE